MIRTLGLASWQVEEILREDEAFRRSLSSLNVQIARLSQAMDRACLNSAMDRKDVLVLAEQIGELKKKQLVQRAESRLRIKDLLGPEQIEKLRLRQVRQRIMPSRQEDAGAGLASRAFLQDPAGRGSHFSNDAKRN